MDAFDIIAALVALFPVLVLVVVNAAESLKSDPQLSNREHARRTGAGHPLVQKVRDKLESEGGLEQYSSRMSADGRERPASQPERPDPEPELVAGGAVRSDMESTAQMAQSETRVSGDGRLEQHSSRMSAELVAGGEIPHVDVAQRYFSSHFVTRGVPRVPAQKSRKGVGLCTHPAK